MRCTRREVLGLSGGALAWFPCRLASADGEAPVRLAISETVMGDVNLNDARAAMQVWVKRLTANLNVTLDPKLFSSTQDILDRVRKGQLDAIALNILEYRQIASLLDASQIVNAAGDAAMEQYLLLIRKSGGAKQIGDLKGRRLCRLNGPRMCVAPAWLSTTLDEGHFGPPEQFFGSIVDDPKFARVVLPVFFGQADACVTSRRGFETMCELNPQVGRDLVTLASSPPLTVSFYIFRKNYRNSEREKVIKAISSLRRSPGGQELATLFQFEELAVKDAECLTSALNLLDRADRVRARQMGGGRK